MRQRSCSKVFLLLFAMQRVVSRSCFGDVSKVLDRSLSLIVGHSNRDESAMLGFLTAHLAIHEPRTELEKGCFRLWG